MIVVLPNTGYITLIWAVNKYGVVFFFNLYRWLWRDMKGYISLTSTLSFWDTHCFVFVYISLCLYVIFEENKFISSNIIQEQVTGTSI